MSSSSSSSTTTSWTAVFDTELCADCIECNDSGDIAIGTYQLCSDDGSKTGRLWLFKDGTLARSPVHSLDTDAIFDLLWLNNEHLMIATNNKGIGMLNWVAEGCTVSYSSDDSSACLAMDVGLNNDHLVCSTASGSIVTYDVNSLNRLSAFKAHDDFEVWTVTVNLDAKCILSGADDSLLKLWDSSSLNCTSIVRHHQAGVCSIAINPIDTNYFASGSYDKHVRIWDLRQLSAPVAIKSVASGVWRLRWIDGKSLLAACMHDGFHVFDWWSDDGICTRDHRPTDSLAYGCCFAGDTALTCTFYNHQAQEWTMKG